MSETDVASVCWRCRPQSWRPANRLRRSNDGDSAATQQEPNILFIMGDDIGLMQPSIYHRGLMVGETPTSTASATKARCS